MKNNTMFVILSIVALSSSFAHATIKEHLKLALEQIKPKIAQDPKVKELVQAIKAKTETFKAPDVDPFTEAGSKKYRELEKQWRKEIEELPAIAQLAAKIKENFDEKTLQIIKEMGQLAKIELKKHAELEALEAEFDKKASNIEPKQEVELDALREEYYKNRSKIDNKPEYKVLAERMKDMDAFFLFTQELLKAANNNSGFLSPGWQLAFIKPLLGIE